MNIDWKHVLKVIALTAIALAARGAFGVFVGLLAADVTAWLHGGSVTVAGVGLSPLMAGLGVLISMCARDTGEVEPNTARGLY